MKSGRHKYILLFITITILATIGLQIYWNFKNYKENKVQFIKEVQTAFDNSIEYYYAEDSKNNFLRFVDGNDTVIKENFIKRLNLDTAFKNQVSRTEIIKNSNLSSKTEIHKNNSMISSVFILKGEKEPIAGNISKLKDLTNRIAVSMAQDSIKFKNLSKAVDKEFARKNIKIEYSLQHYKADTLFDQFKKNPKLKLPLSAFSSTNYLPPNQELQISFSDPIVLILKRSFIEILLSLLLSLSIIFCLLYLLKTINKQKKIDEIKNDLISNITHEFKTPITTISSAIEGIRNFNDIDDKEKTRRYLNISGQQLKKLEIMVEKLLETASLDTNELILNKESINIVELIKANIEKHQMIASEKEITFRTNLEILDCKVDLFHFENAISNLIDNAIKYGGNKINVSLFQTGKQTKITIEDNGIGIDKTQREKIFDKFYRIPKGNVHDVKGFGIGLYYSKKIIEKHGGTLELVPNEKTTIFKISFPDDK